MLDELLEIAQNSSEFVDYPNYGAGDCGEIYYTDDISMINLKDIIEQLKIKYERKY